MKAPQAISPPSFGVSISVRMLPQLLLPCLALNASQAAGWNEAVDGDISSIQNAPSVLLLSEGINAVEGTVGGSPDGQDWITLTIPFGCELRSVELKTFDSLNDSTAFTGLAAGSVFTGSHLSADSYLGYTHFGPGNIGTNLLPVLGTANLAQGFTPPLPAGDYAFLIQQTGSLPTTYRFDYTVAAVPEASAAALGLTAVGGLLMTRRRHAVKARFH